MQETTRQWLLFCLYEDLGATRSIPQLREAITPRLKEFGFARVPSLRTLYRWAKDFQWRERLAERASEASKSDAEIFDETQREMNERHVVFSHLLLHIAIQCLKSRVLEFIEAELFQAFDQGVSLERQAREAKTSGKAKREMNERHAVFGVQMQSIAIQGLEARVQDLTILAFFQAHDLGISLERLATEAIEQHSTSDDSRCGNPVDWLKLYNRK